MIHITFPDGTVKTFDSGTTAMAIARSISEGLARKVLAAKVNGDVWDAERPIHHDAQVKLLTWDDHEGRAAFWHSSAHLMAEALEHLYPGIKFGIGPPVDGGFYYDVDPGSQTISISDLPAVEAKMLELARTKSTFIRREVSKDDAIGYFREKGDEYKLELISELQDGEITFYEQGSFVDLCKGPHIPSTELIKAVKLLNVAGAYWRGDESRKQLIRIYGVTFPKQSMLTEHLELLEEAKKRDHRKLGSELELFMFSDKVGAGLPLWLPKGTTLRSRLEDFLKNEQLARGYLPVITPHIGKKDLWVTSGHYEKYGKDSFKPIQTPKEDEEFLLKPMNCPHHCEIFGHRPRSYKELPMRIAEFGTVYRYEQSGELHGLTRVRGFTVDDSHIFCTPDQLKDEFLGALDLTTYVLHRLGFSNYTAQISLRDPKDKEKYIGSDENWDKAETTIIEAVQESGLEAVTELGEAAFYGPKLDFMVKDALQRSWQLGTIQVDYNLPERFGLEYIGPDNQPHRAIMIHRAPFGSMERFIGVLIEHCDGKFPLWLAPEQYALLPIGDRHVAYCREVMAELLSHDVRGYIDDRSETIGKKIRDTELKRIPFMLIVGDKEIESRMISVRRQGEGDKGSMSVGDFAMEMSRLVND